MIIAAVIIVNAIWLLFALYLNDSWENYCIDQLEIVLEFLDDYTEIIEAITSSDKPRKTMNEIREEYGLPPVDMEAQEEEDAY